MTALAQPDENKLYFLRPISDWQSQLRRDATVVILLDPFKLPVGVGRAATAIDFLLLSAQGAGGTITDWKGRNLCFTPGPNGVLDPATMPGEIVAAGDSRVHQQVLDAIGWA